jgi:glycosyltransferase involved in cell wall biosynthesis
MKKTYKILLIGPFPPPYSGMTIQMTLWREFLIQEGHKVGHISTLPRLKKIAPVRSILFLIHLLMKVPRYHIINIHSGSGLYFFAFTVPVVILSKILRKRVFITFKGGEADKFFSTHPKAKRYLKQADAILVPSGYLKSLFSGLDIDAHVVYNILNIKERSDEIAENFQDKVNLIVARNLEPFYNIRMAIDAFRIIKKEVSEAVLHIFGDGSERQKLESYVNKLNIPDIIFHGNVQHNELYKYYRASHVFLNPSFIDNAPNSVIEAYYFKVPVVSTNVGGVPYILENGVSGYLVEPDNAQAMAQCALKILKNKKFADRFIEKGKEIMERHSWSNIYQSFLKIVESQQN